jgi:putative PIN family toxin of toxin-antitoxin system
LLRVVFDANVFISALLSPRGSPAQLLRLWVGGAFDLVVSPLLLAELERALSYPKLARVVNPDEARTFVEELRNSAVLLDDPSEVESGVTRDPKDDYLVALARTASADVLVSGDPHITEVPGLEPPVLTPRELLEILERA